MGYLKVAMCSLSRFYVGNLKVQMQAFCGKIEGQDMRQEKPRLGSLGLMWHEIFFRGFIVGFSRVV